MLLPTYCQHHAPPVRPLSYTRTNTSSSVRQHPSMQAGRYRLQLPFPSHSLFSSTYYALAICAAMLDTRLPCSPLRYLTPHSVFLCVCSHCILHTSHRHTAVRLPLYVACIECPPIYPQWARRVSRQLLLSFLPPTVSSQRRPSAIAVYSPTTHKFVTSSNVHVHTLTLHNAFSLPF